MLACENVLHEKQVCLAKLEIWPSAVSSFYRQLLDEFEISPDDECFKVHGKKVDDPSEGLALFSSTCGLRYWEKITSWMSRTL
ncbi:MAG: hypothetical protein SGPRY_004985 [Prymnesium sp.]